MRTTTKKAKTQRLRKPSDAEIVARFEKVFDIPKRIDIIETAARAAVDGGRRFNPLNAHMAETHAAAALMQLGEKVAPTPDIDSVRAALVAINRLARVGEPEDFDAILMLVAVAKNAWPSALPRRSRAPADRPSRPGATTSPPRA